MDDLDTRVTVAPSGRNFQTDSLDMMKTIPCTVKIGERLSNGRYIVEELLGEGAMGQVFRCTDTFSKTDVAIKIVPPALTGNSDA
ncbi:MAG: hypothetical protein IJW23_09180, partial [Lentisphaeria bacterium]|nr:hypothetical protein [Lentisphaeria bacterium]MBQ9771979.1 hypothetical protein [Lentisphaeria bacterium]